MSVACVRPVLVSFTSRKNPPREPLLGLLDLSGLEEGAFETVEECWLSSRFEMAEEEAIVVENVEFKSGVSPLSSPLKLVVDLMFSIFLRFFLGR